MRICRKKAVKQSKTVKILYSKQYQDREMRDLPSRGTAARAEAMNKMKKKKKRAEVNVFIFFERMGLGVAKQVWL